MSRLINLLVFGLMCPVALAQGNFANISRPYNFNAPDLSSLIPFSSEQLAQFKYNKVKLVFAEESNGVNGIFYFNEKGQLEKERTWYWEKNKKVFTDSTIYRYNNRGQLILARSFDGAEAYDSIAYDENGRMTYYVSQEFVKDKKNKKTKLLLWDLRLLKNDDDNFILEDKVDSANRLWVIFDRNNRVLKSWSANRRDSIGAGTHLPTDGPRYSSEICYYRESGSPKFLLGREKVFSDGLLISEIQYDMNETGRIYKRTDYVYSKANKVLQANDSYSSQLKTIFIYDNKGLPTEEVSLMPDEVEITFFTYQYY